MANLELDLLDNAIDSLNEALSKYQDGQDGNDNAFKFCIQHLAHFFELVLKYYVTQSHPLLIYKNPFAKSFNEESPTIGLFEAINFLSNEGNAVSDRFRKDLHWLKKLRNGIEHHKFSMVIGDVEEAIGRLMRAAVEFDESHKTIGLGDYISEDYYDLFHELANTYEHKLQKALEEVKVILFSLDPSEENTNIYHCYECDHDTMAPSLVSDTGYRCTFCGAEESEDIEVECAICGQWWAGWQMQLLDWADTGTYEHFCPYCLHDPAYRKDD